VRRGPEKVDYLSEILTGYQKLFLKSLGDGVYLDISLLSEKPLIKAD
jgi:hypothetical protein